MRRSCHRGRVAGERSELSIDLRWLNFVNDAAVVCRPVTHYWLGAPMYAIRLDSGGYKFSAVRVTQLSTGRTRRPASADRTARRQFQATGQPVSRTQASDAMTSRLPSYEAKCVQRRCFQCGPVSLRSDIKGMELPPANILIPLERQLIALQLCREQFLYNETLQQPFRLVLSKLPKRRQM